MGTAVRIAALLLTSLTSAGALLLLLPGLKEGLDSADLPLIGVGAAGLLAAGTAWLLLGRGVLRLAGLVVLALPLLLYCLAAGRMAAGIWMGRQLASRTRIAALRAAPVTWPGFDGPIGVRLEIEVERPSGLRGNLFPPKLALAPIEEKSYFGFNGPHLAEPPFPLGSAPYTFPGKVAYDLYPSGVQRAEAAERRLCLDGGLPPEPAGSGPVSAAWFFAGPSGLRADLSGLLTAELRRSAGVPGAADWPAMFRRLRPDGLAAAGYRPCPTPPSAMSGSCYCFQ